MTAPRLQPLNPQPQHAHHVAIAALPWALLAAILVTVAVVAIGVLL